MLRTAITSGTSTEDGLLQKPLDHAIQRDKALSCLTQRAGIFPLGNCPPSDAFLAEYLVTASALFRLVHECQANVALE